MLHLTRLLPWLALAAAPACHSAAPSERLSAADFGSGFVEAAVAAPAPAPLPAVRPGLEVLLSDSVHLVRGKRVGLITNHTAVTTAGQSAIDALYEAPGVKLVALYAPEHGIRGTADGGASIADSRDEKTGVPIFSLYGRTQKPTAAMLKGVDVLLFDMQDIGARPYTYVWTMAMAMEVAAEQKIPFVVLDRPNPITASAEGGVMEFEMRNRGQAITGYYPVPLRHGMTAGEIAKYVNGEYKVSAELHVVPAQGWRSDAWYDETGLPWVNPSPNIRSLDAALAYSGLVMLEATNLSVGRGTAEPFSYVGAPYLDNVELLRRVRRYELPGVRFDTASYTPRGTGWMQFRDQRVRAVRLTITDRNEFRPVLTALVFLSEIQKMHPEKLGMGSMLQMLGSRWAPAAVRRGDDPREIYRRWEQELSGDWAAIRERYRLYPRS